MNFTRNSDLVTASIQTAIMFTLMSEMFKFGSFKQLKLTGPTNTEFPGEVAGGYATLWKILSDGGTADVSTIDSEAAIDKFMDYAILKGAINPGPTWYPAERIHDYWYARERISRPDGQEDAS